MSRRKVTTIPATRASNQSAPGAPKRRRVAAYARVSTDHEEQHTSYESQIAYYTGYIQSRPDWEFAGVYTDEGITGTSTKRREGFKAMVSTALAGGIDLILTKSVSRFARNTVDSLTTIRDLKDAGVEVYFEKENIWTFDGKGELLITIMSSFAQEESRSLSENCKWGKQKLLAEGRVWVPYSRFLGYDKGPDGELVVNPEQAEVVRRIFRMCLEGRSHMEIARALEADGVRTGGGGERWTWGSIDQILRNEKYKGDALLQKTYVPDFLTKKQVRNTGQVPQYYVEGNHEAIVDPGVFDAVQRELARRKSGGGKRTSSPFEGRVRCGVCGAKYGRFVWHSNQPNRKEVMRCLQKYKTKPPCPSKHTTEEALRAAFVSAMNKALSSRKSICDRLRRAIGGALDTAALEAERDRVRASLGGEAPSEEATARLSELTDEIGRRRGAAWEAEAFIAEVEGLPRLMRDFDERLWYALADFATVRPDGSISVTFKNGLEIEA